MLSEDTKILEFCQYQKCDKTPFIIYADLECLLEKIDGCKNNPENSSTTKVGDNISFRSIEKKRKTYRGKLRGKLLLKEQQESYVNAKIYYICKEKFENKYLKDKKHHKVRDHCH